MKQATKIHYVSKSTNTFKNMSDSYEDSSFDKLSQESDDDFWVNITKSPTLSRRHSQSHLTNLPRNEQRSLSLEEQVKFTSSPNSQSVVKSTLDSPKQIRQQIADDINRLRYETSLVIRRKLKNARKEVTEEFDEEFCSMKDLFNSELAKMKLGYQTVQSLLSSKSIQIDLLEKEIMRKELLIDNYRINRKTFKSKADKSRNSVHNLVDTVEIYHDNKTIKVKLEGTKAYCIHLLEERKKRKLSIKGLEIKLRNLFSENEENKQKLLTALSSKEKKIQASIDELSNGFDVYRAKRAIQIETREKEFVKQADLIEKLQRELRNVKRSIKVPTNYQVLEIKEESSIPAGKKSTVNSIQKLDKLMCKKKGDKPPLLKRYDDRGDKVFNYRDHALRMKQIERKRSTNRSATLSPMSQLKIRTRLNSTDLSMSIVQESLMEI